MPARRAPVSRQAPIALALTDCKLGHRGTPMASEAKPEEKPAVAPPPIAGKARDLEALRSAVVDAANVSTGFWFSYLFVLLYFIVAVGGVTHKMLLFESAVKLPIIGVDLPLTGFFVLGPLLFLI